MSKVSSFSITSLQSEELLGFSIEIADKIRPVSAISENAICVKWFSALSEYSKALNVEKEYSYNDLVEADASVDQAITGLRMHLQALLIYPDDEPREAARIIWNAIDQYGSPTQLNFNKEYAIVIRMLETLESLDKNLLKKATVEAWVPALRERYDAFMAMMKSYDAERAGITPGTTKTARLELLNTWSTLCDFINGTALINTTPELEMMIAEINTRIQSKKTALKSRRTSRKNAREAAAEPAVIEE